MYKSHKNQEGQSQLHRKDVPVIEIPDEGDYTQKQATQQITQSNQINAFYLYGKNSPSGKSFPTSVRSTKFKPVLNGRQNTQIGTPKELISGTPKKGTNSLKSSGRTTPRTQMKKPVGVNYMLNGTQKNGQNPFLKKVDIVAPEGSKPTSPYIFQTNNHQSKLQGVTKSQTPKASSNNVNGFNGQVQRVAQTSVSKVRQVQTQQITGGRQIPIQQGAQYSNQVKAETPENLESNQNAKNIYRSLDKNIGKYEPQIQEVSKQASTPSGRIYSSTPKAQVTKSAVGTQKNSARNQEVNSSTPNLSRTLQQEKLQKQQQQISQYQRQLGQQTQQQQKQQQSLQQQMQSIQQNQQQQQKAESINQYVTKVNIQQNNQTAKPSKPDLTNKQQAQKSEEIYRQHLFQTFQAMKFVQTIQPADPQQLKNKRVFLPKRQSHVSKKTVVFDLDETLVHCCDDLSQNPDVVLPVTFPTGEVVNAGINIRPFAKDCLTEANKNFEVIVFTASHQCYADVVLNYLDPTGELIHHRLYRESCVVTDGIYIKDLRILANRNLKDVIIVDNAAYSFGYQIDNGIPIISWHDDKYDKELFNLIDYLKILSEVDDIRDVNKKTFHLQTFYEDYLREFICGVNNSPKGRKSPVNGKV